MGHTNNTLLTSLASSSSNRMDVALAVAAWVREGTEKAKNEKEPFRPGSGVLEGVSAMRKNGNMDAVLGIIDGLAMAKRSGTLPGSGIGKTLGYALGCDGDAGNGPTTCFKQIQDKGMEGELLSACQKIEGDVTLADLISRSSSNFSWVVASAPDNNGRGQGFELARMLLDHHPHLAIHVDMEILLDRVGAASSSMKPETINGQLINLSRLVVDGLVATLSSPRERRYRAHLNSGPKGLACAIVKALSVMLDFGLLDNEQMKQLTEGKRGRLLDKTLGRAGELGVSKTPAKVRELHALRSCVRSACLASKAVNAQGSGNRPPRI